MVDRDIPQHPRLGSAPAGSSICVSYSVINYLLCQLASRLGNPDSQPRSTGSISTHIAKLMQLSWYALGTYICTQCGQHKSLGTYICTYTPPSWQIMACSFLEDAVLVCLQTLTHISSLMLRWFCLYMMVSP